MQEKLQKIFPEIKILRPRNCQSVQFSFEINKICKVFKIKIFFLIEKKKKK